MIWDSRGLPPAKPFPRRSPPKALEISEARLPRSEAPPLLFPTGLASKASGELGKESCWQQGLQGLALPLVGGLGDASRREPLEELVSLGSVRLSWLVLNRLHLLQLFSSRDAARSSRGFRGGLGVIDLIFILALSSSGRSFKVSLMGVPIFGGAPSPPASFLAAFPAFFACRSCTAPPSMLRVRHTLECCGNPFGVLIVPQVPAMDAAPDENFLKAWFPSLYHPVGSQGFTQPARHGNCRQLSL